MNYDDFGLRVDYTEYTVKKGDSLYNIAKKYNTTVSALTDVNMLTSNNIFPGQVLLIPRYSNETDEYYFESYVSQPGETIELIASKAGVDPVLLGIYNDFANFQLANGQIIKIPRNNSYVVKENDTVDSLLSSTNRTADEILRANAGNWLKIGNRVNL